VSDTLLTELRAHSKLQIGTGSLLYQDWQRFAITCGNFSDRMLKKVSQHTRPTPARQDAPSPMHRFRLESIFNVAMGTELR